MNFSRNPSHGQTALVLIPELMGPALRTRSSGCHSKVRCVLHGQDSITPTMVGGNKIHAITSKQPRRHDLRYGDVVWRQYPRHDAMVGVPTVPLEGYGYASRCKCTRYSLMDSSFYLPSLFLASRPQSPSHGDGPWCREWLLFK